MSKECNYRLKASVDNRAVLPSHVSLVVYIVLSRPLLSFWTRRIILSEFSFFGFIRCIRHSDRILVNKKKYSQFDNDRVTLINSKRTQFSSNESLKI